MRYKSTRKPRIALLVDNPYRDLPGLVLTAWRLCQNGAICYLVPMNLRDKEIWQLAPDFVLLNHFRTIYEKLVSHLLEAGILVGVLDTEGSVFSTLSDPENVPAGDSKQVEKKSNDVHEYTLSMARDKALRHSITLYCAWTPAFGDYALREDWYRSEQIVVTGTPRTDFYAPLWREAALRMSSYVDAYPEPMILINGSFTLANPRFKSQEEEAEMLTVNFSYSKDFVAKWMQAQTTALAGLVSLANKLARRFPETTFILRPHPFENDETYKKMLEPLPNLSLVKKGTVDGWLLRAKALIHWGSSTAIEAGLAAVPVFTPGWLPMHIPLPMVDNLSIACPTEEELLASIASVLNNSFEISSEISGRIEKTVEETFYKIDGFAHRRVADAVLQTVHLAGSSASIERCRYFAYNVKGFKEKAVARIKELFGLPPDRPLREWRNPTYEFAWWDHSEKYFDTERVKSMIDAIAASAPAESGEPLRQIRVQSAQKHGDYHFGYRQGRSVTLFPQ